MAVENKKRTVTFLAVDGSGKTKTIQRLLGLKESIKGEPEEEKRNYTLFARSYTTDDAGRTINLLDTPGSLNYLNDVVNCIRVSDGAVYVINTVAGATEHGLRHWRKLKEFNIPSLIYINEMDDEKADMDRTLDSIKDVFGVIGLPIVVPVGKGANLKGLINLISNKFYAYDDSGKSKESDIPAEHSEIAEKYRTKMIEAIVETDEALMERYFAGQEIADAELMAALNKAVSERTAFPVFTGSSKYNVGIDLLKNALFFYFHNSLEHTNLKFTDGSTPQLSETAPFSAYVYKVKIDNYVGKMCFLKIVSGKIDKNSRLVVSNTGNAVKLAKIYKPYFAGLKPVEEASIGDIVVLDKCDEIRTGSTIVDTSLSSKIFAPSPDPKRVLSFAIDVSDKNLEEKVVIALKKIGDEDPSIKYERVPETKDLLVSGLGQLQMDVVKEMLKDKFKLDVTYRAPRISYRETITKVTQVQGKHKKQSGGHGQFADTWMKFEALPRNKGFDFVDEIVGGAIPKNFIPSVEKGLRKAMERGPVAGYPLIDFKVTLYDGGYHDVDSSDMAFQIAARVGFKKAMEETKPVLLEPIMEITVNIPDQYVGSITNDLSSRRGRIKGMDNIEEVGSVVRAEVPLGELSTYASELHSITQGLGLFEMQFLRYEEVPPMYINKIIEDTKKWKEEEKADF